MIHNAVCTKQGGIPGGRNFQPTVPTATRALPLRAPTARGAAACGAVTRQHGPSDAGGKNSPGKGGVCIIRGEGWLGAPGWKALLSLERRRARRRILLRAMRALGGGLGSSSATTAIKARSSEQLNPCPKELWGGLDR